MKHRVLVVDDIPLNVEVLSEVLGDTYEVVAALSGKDALRLASNTPYPDLILLDIQLPDMDGYEVCRFLKIQKETRDIPIIFVTTMDSDDDEERGFKVGGVDYIRKPISPSIVMSRVKTQLALYDQTRRLSELVWERTKELEKAKDEAERANKFKSAFLANMNHELRTPLNAIMGMTQLLLETNITSEQQVFLTEELRATKKLVKIIDDIFELARLEAGTVPVRNMKFLLNDMFESLSALYKQAFEEKGVIFSLISKEPLNLIYSDYHKIQQVLVNLINNSMRYTAKGRVEVEVASICKSAVSTGVDQCGLNDMLVISVTDTGKGIPQDKLAYVLEAFNIGEDYMTKQVDGLGTGLTVAAKLIETLKGTIRIDSEYGQGTEVIFTVPCQLDVV
ncbi:MAG: response regulator [Desulfovibrio sp.]